MGICLLSNPFQLWEAFFGIDPSFPNTFNPTTAFIASYGTCTFKDLSPYFDCDENLQNYDFTALLNEMKGA